MVQQVRVMLWVAGMAALVSWSALSAEIVVSTDGTGSFRSIQRAIDAATYGDTILVNPGIYEETLVLNSGITIRGAGSNHTIVQSSYGYDPVVSGAIVGAVTLEDLGFQRNPSILESVVIDLISSDVTFRDCRITGGQLGGLRSQGTAILSIDQCTIEDNAGFGLHIRDGAQLHLSNAAIADNGGSGLILDGSTASIAQSVIRRNGWDGLQVGGTSDAQCVQSTLSNNGRWGLSAEGIAQITLTDCSLESAASGNVLAEDSVKLALQGCRITGGTQAAILARGTSDTGIYDTSVNRAAGHGVQLDGSASLTMTHASVARCGGNGLLLETGGQCALRNLTVAYNTDQGLEFSGTHIELSESIVSLNGGIGLKITPTAASDQSLRFSYNNVWGNRAGDYIGVQRSSSDTALPPGLIETAAGSLVLLEDSPCIGAGRFGTTLGATANPNWDGGGRVGAVMSLRDTRLGTFEMTARWCPLPDEVLVLAGAWEYAWDHARAELQSSLINWSPAQTVATLEYNPGDIARAQAVSFDLSLGASGVWNGATNRWSVWGAIDFRLGSLGAEIFSVYDGPFGTTRQDFELSFGTLAVQAHASDLLLSQLTAGWYSSHLSTSWPVDLEFELQLLPDQRMHAALAWPLHEGRMLLEAQGFIKELTTGSASLTWRASNGSAAGASLNIREGAFEDAAVHLSLRVGAALLSGSLGANAMTSPRFEFTIDVNTSLWFSPPPNELPLPVLGFSPLNPEAGEPVAFSAEGSTDPDGSLDQIWWEFGDGEADLGRSVEHVYREAGTYSVTLMISDDQGAVATRSESITILESQSKPAASFVWVPATAAGAVINRQLRAGDWILLDARDSYDPNGTIIEYNWDLQADGQFDETAAEPTLLIEPFLSGAWPITLRVIDDEGHSDAVMHVLTLEERKPPQAAFEQSPVLPASGDPIRFLDRSAEGDAPIVSWYWDFGDGETSRDREPAHRYTFPGTYVVQLTVVDEEGFEHSITRTLEIQVNPSLVPIETVWALVIGISDYDEVDDLSYASRDAEAVADWLLHHEVPAEQIRLLTDESASSDSGVDRADATLLNVREGLGWLRMNATPNDLVIIHFSGHGYQGADDNGDERDSVDEFFVLKDTRALAKDDTALRDDEFGRLLDRIESNHVMIFFDSCYSGGLSRSLSPGSRATGDSLDVFSDFSLEGRLVLSASSESQDAFESPDLQHGVFTHYVLLGLSGAADLNDDDHVTAWELFEYVRTEVPPFVERERGEIQIPQLIGEGESRIVLVHPDSESSD